MIVATVSKSLASICFLGQCHPALVGEATPTGEYTLSKRIVLSEGYGGDVLQFKVDEKYVYAIHRPWSLDKKRNRNTLLSASPGQRIMTSGCVNVSNHVYDQLFKNSYKIKVIITM